MPKRFQMPALGEELLKPFVVKLPDPKFASTDHPKLSRLRELCAEFKKQIQKETRSTRFGHIDDELAREAFVLAADLDFARAPVERIEFERGVTNIDWQSVEHPVISAGPLPHDWPGHVYPEV